MANAKIPVKNSCNFALEYCAEHAHSQLNYCNELVKEATSPTRIVVLK